MKKVRFSNGIQGKGFAAALALSLCAVGISTYAAYSGAVGTANKASETSAADDNVFIFTQPAETVNAEVFDVPKDDPGQTEAVTTAVDDPEPVLADEAGLFFKDPKTMPISDCTVINPYSGGELVKSETLGVWKTHDGVDLAADLGTAVSSIMKGTVTEVKNDPLWGICVTIDHGDGAIGYYCGLDENINVKEGQQVAMGEIIGKVGNTADAECKLAPHLHLAVTVAGAYTDPIKFIEN